jgi:phosphoserine phosphatase RsbU/P
MKVLAVEDDPLSRFVLVSTLQSLDCEVEAVERGEAAWARLELGGIRLVVGDWRMPGLDGLELCRRIRARGGEYVYYILLTEVEATEANETLAIEAGVDDFLSKPIVPHELRNRLRVARRILGYTTQVRQLESFIPICGFCHRVRNDDNYWQQIDSYIGERTGTLLSRGMCPDCYRNNVVEPLRTAEPEQSSEAPVTEAQEPPSRPRARATLAMIAKRLDVTVATVSMALRNNRRISAEMRSRVRAVADEIGYEPDPTIGRMMHRLRQGRPATFKSMLCALTPLMEQQYFPYVTEVIRGAQMQAVKHGYGISVIHVTKREIESGRLHRMLMSRGVEGVLLLPVGTRLDCTSWVDWNHFSVAATDLAVSAPDVDRVASHWYHSIMQIYAELSAHGVRRIGAVLSREFDAAVNHKLTAGIAWNHAHGSVESVVPFLFEAQHGSPERAGPEWCQTVTLTNPSANAGQTLEAWFEQERPEIIVAQNEEHAHWIRGTLRSENLVTVSIVVLNRPESSTFAGVVERPFEIGITAVDLLDRKIQSEEKGAPSVRSVTHIKGYWASGGSLRRTSLAQTNMGA